jgi:excisionase family DNA binding protein
MQHNPEDLRSYLTTPQAARRSGLSTTYLTKLLRKGSLEGFRLGRDWLIYTDSLDTFLAVPHKPGPKGPRKRHVQEHSDTTPVNLNPDKGSDHREKERLNRVSCRSVDDQVEWKA